MATDNCKIKFGKSWIGMVTSDKVERMFAEVGVEVNDVLRSIPFAHVVTVLYLVGNISFQNVPRLPLPSTSVKQYKGKKRQWP